MRKRVLLRNGLIAIIWLLWLVGMAVGERWELFATLWPISVTMMAGSFVAGATSEGGGAVAFPVLTLVFGIEPATARDFSLLIQSVGMTTAMASIFLTGIKVSYRTIVLASIGGLVGTPIGLSIVSPLLPPAATKMFFVSLWLSLAVCLYLLDRRRDVSRRLELAEDNVWVWVTVPLAGVLGGVVSGLTGSGIDIMTFAVVVLLFRLNEEVATPTSVCLMGLNTVWGAVWRANLAGGLAPEAWEMWWVCVPIVVVGAPLGAWFISLHSRRLILVFFYVSTTAQFVGALLIVPQTPVLLAMSGGTFLAGSGVFYVLDRLGTRGQDETAAQE